MRPFRAYIIESAVRKQNLTLHHRFRWVACQFTALQRCRTKAQLMKTLNGLPKSLYDTYERILTEIDDMYLPDARRLLSFYVMQKDHCGQSSSLRLWQWI